MPNQCPTCLGTGRVLKSVEIVHAPGVKPLEIKKYTICPRCSWVVNDA